METLLCDGVDTIRSKSEVLQVCLASLLILIQNLNIDYAYCCYIVNQMGCLFV